MKNTGLLVMLAVLAGAMFAPNTTAASWVDLAPWVLGGMFALMAIAAIARRNRV